MFSLPSSLVSVGVWSHVYRIIGRDCSVELKRTRAMNSTLYPRPVGEPQGHPLPPKLPKKAAPHLCRLQSHSPVAQLNPGRAQHELDGPASDSRPSFGDATSDSKNNRTAGEVTWVSGSAIQDWASSVPNKSIHQWVGISRPEEFGNNSNSRGNHPSEISSPSLSC